MNDLTNLLPLVVVSGLLSASFLLALALLEQSLGNENLVVGGDGAGVTFRLVRSPAYRVVWFAERRLRIAAEVRHSRVANSKACT